jgi:hypothetical protein
MKFEYTSSWFRIVVEIFRSRSVIAKYRVTPWRMGEEHRRRMLRKVIRQVVEVQL